MPRAAISNTGPQGTTWAHHTAYFSLTTQNSNGNSGAIYRLQTAANGSPLTPNEWRLRLFHNTDKPITGAVNSTYDNQGNLWVVFGTGRIWYANDQIPCGTNRNIPNNDPCLIHNEQYIYGLKEPLNNNGFLTYEEVGHDDDNPPIMDVSGHIVYSSKSSRTGYLRAAYGYPDSDIKYDTYNTLAADLKARNPSGDPLYRGYKRKLETWRIIPISIVLGPDGFDYSYHNPGATRFEIVTTQPKIDGLPNGRSDTTFTSYLTMDSLCDPLGDSYLHVIDTFTGLPHPDHINYVGFAEGKSISADQLNSGEDGMYTQVTGVVEVGRGMSSEATLGGGAGGGGSGGGDSYDATSQTGDLVRISRPPNRGGRGLVSWREVKDTIRLGGDEDEVKVNVLKGLK